MKRLGSARESKLRACLIAVSFCDLFKLALHIAPACCHSHAVDTVSL